MYRNDDFNWHTALPNPSFRRMPESRDDDRGDRVRQPRVVERKVVIEGAVVVWIPVCTGMTILISTQHYQTRHSGTCRNDGRYKKRDTKSIHKIF